MFRLGNILKTVVGLDKLGWIFPIGNVKVGIVSYIRHQDFWLGGYRVINTKSDHENVVAGKIMRKKIRLLVITNYV